MDQFFTPENIAAGLMVGLTTDSYKVVADFAIGDGSLIKALPFRPKSAIGLDLDDTVVSGLKSRFPDWKLKTGDFLRPDDRTAIWLKKWVGKIDLVLLNPPFSCKGGTYENVEIDQNKYKCRVAMAFVVNSIKYLTENGILIAILPLTILKSEFDVKLLDKLREKWHVTIGEKLGRNSFPGCNPHSVVLTIHKKSQVVKISEKAGTKVPVLIKGEILRGSTPMYKTSENGAFPVLHTTNIKGQKLSLDNQKYTSRTVRTVSGSYLIVPRVGNPTVDKIAIISDATEFILSDCLFAIACKDFQSLCFVKDVIRSNWQEFKALYDSTCAPYVTVAQLTMFLEKFAVQLTNVERIGAASGLRSKPRLPQHLDSYKVN